MVGELGEARSDGRPGKERPQQGQTEAQGSFFGKPLGCELPAARRWRGEPCRHFQRSLRSRRATVVCAFGSYLDCRKGLGQSTSKFVWTWRPQLSSAEQRIAWNLKREADAKSKPIWTHWNTRPTVETVEGTTTPIKASSSLQLNGAATLPIKIGGLTELWKLCS